MSHRLLLVLHVDDLREALVIGCHVERMWALVSLILPFDLARNIIGVGHIYSTCEVVGHG